MIQTSELLLVGTVAAVGVLHTIVPDHWVPITLIARQRGWSKAETARASFKAGVGHVLSTLAIALVIWLGGGGGCDAIRALGRHDCESGVDRVRRLDRDIGVARGPWKERARTCSRSRAS